MNAVLLSYHLINYSEVEHRFLFLEEQNPIRAVQSLQMNWDVNLDPFEKGIKK